MSLMETPFTCRYSIYFGGYDFVRLDGLIGNRVAEKMFINAALLIVLVLVISFHRSLGESNKDTFPDDGSFDSTSKPNLHRPCLELRDKTIINFKAFDKNHSVTVKQHKSILNPVTLVRVFNGIYSNSTIDGYTFIPCLVSGLTEEDGKRVVVYGIILNDSFNGLAIHGDGIHHIRQVGLHNASHHSFTSGVSLNEPGKNNRVESYPHFKMQTKKPWPELRILYARHCSLRLIADHTFLRDVGNGDIGIALSFMTHLVQEANNLFRAVDTDGSGLPGQIGFKVREMVVFQENATPSIYPLHDVSLTSTQVLQKTVAFKDPHVCYVLLFTARPFLENNLGKSHSWNFGPDEVTTQGGICGAEAENGGLPNTGFVSMRLGKQMLPPNVAVLAVTRVLATAFGSRIDLNHINCPVGPNVTNVMDSYFPPPSNLWKNINNAGFSRCSLKDMKQAILQKAVCLNEALPVSGQIAEDNGYYLKIVSAACRHHFQSWEVGLWLSSTVIVTLVLLSPTHL